MIVHVWIYSKAPITIKQCLLQLWSVEPRHSNVPDEIKKQESSLLTRVRTSNHALPSSLLPSPVQCLEPSIQQTAHLRPRDLTTAHSRLAYLQISLTNDRSFGFMLVSSDQATPLIDVQKVEYDLD